MGATYTRQSSYTDGDTITASDTNNEFDQLVAAFAASTGHTHDGTAGEGGPVELLATNTITFGTGADTDIVITFNANTNDGILKWMEDEDYFEFSDDILIATTEKIQFRDTAIYINSSVDGQLDIVADTEIQIAATTVDINGNVDISGTLTIGSAGISEAELEILDGATVTTTELNIIDGGTSASATTVVDADRVVFNDAGTMKQVAVTDLAAYFDDEITAMPNLVSTGALNSGSITSGFTSIDVGSGAIATTGTMTYGSLSDGSITITAFVDEDNMASDSATLLPTQQSVKAYVDAAQAAVTTSFQLEDDDGTEVAITNAKEIKFIGSGLTTNWTDVSTGSDADPYDLTFTVDAAQTGITSLLATDIKIGEDDQTKIDFETADEIHFYAANVEQVYVGDNIFGPQSDSDVDLGSTGVRWKDAFVDAITVTGEIDGASLDISGNADIDGTLEADAITVGGTALATLIAATTVTNSTNSTTTTNATNSSHVLVTDNENTNEENLIAFVEGATSTTGNVGLEMDGNFAYNPSTGTVSATIFKGNIDAVDGDFDGTLEADAITIGGTAVTATATLDTGISNNNVPKFTSGVADDDFLRVAGTVIEGRSAAEVLSDIGASAVAGSSSIVTTGALNAGSITSGFGTIDTGASTITTTGVITGGTLEATTDTAAGDNAAIGFTAAEGLILTGQGSTNDITVKNDADASVFVVPTGTQKMVMGQATSFGGANSSILEVMKVGNAAVGFGRGDADLGACVRFFKVNSGGTGTIVGSISLASSSTTYATSSDYRLKTSVQYDWDATTRLKNLKPARFKWISDGDGAEFVDGFIAHEAATVVPEAVTGDKDAVDSDDNIDPQGIDASKLVPLLCKTILELEARITALENA